MSEHLGFDWQPSLAGTCSRFAVRHALLCLGIPPTNDSLSATMDVNRFLLPMGADERAIERGIRGHGCKPVVVHAATRRQFRQQVDKLLRTGLPCIILVDSYRHWAVLSGRTGADYWWIDSSDDDLMGPWSWSDVADWIEAAGETKPYYAIGVKPNVASYLRSSLVHDFSSAAEVLADPVVCKYWGWYLAELNDVFDEAGRGSISADAFFNAHGNAIVGATVAHFEGEVDRSSAQWELAALCEVATAHRMRLSPVNVSRAISGLTLSVVRLLA